MPNNNREEDPNNITFSPVVIEFEVSGGITPESSDGSVIMATVAFLTANRNKLMQLCREEDTTLDLKRFDRIFHLLMANDISTALSESVRTTVLILDILCANKIGK